MEQKSKFFTRRKFIGALGLAAAAGVGYARFIEPHRLGVGRHEVKLSRPAVSSPLKVLQLSDFHASPVVSLEFISEAIRLGLSEKPDLICLTGDFITHQYDQFAAYAKVLAPLAQAAPTFACLGNHDGGRWAATARGYADTRLVRELLATAGVKLLHNSAEAVALRGWDLSLVGLGDSWAKEFEPASAFPPPPGAATTTLVLSHNPDTKHALADYPWDLLLCGHTHGGQLKLPLLGTPFAPVVDKRFVEGLHRWRERWIHITRGVGSLHGMRFNCPPEVSLLTLT